MTDSNQDVSGSDVAKAIDKTEDTLTPSTKSKSSIKTTGNGTLIISSIGLLLSLGSIFVGAFAIKMVKEVKIQVATESKNAYERNTVLVGQIQVISQNLDNGIQSMQDTSRKANENNISSIKERLDTVARGVEIKVQPMISSIGLRITDQIDSEMKKSASERQNTTNQLQGFITKLNLMEAEFKTLSDAVKRLDARGSEARESILLSNASIKDNLSTVNESSQQIKILNELVQKQGDKIQEIKKVIEMYQSKMQRGF